MNEINAIHCGDNLKVMKKMDSESVDLIYLDPPFFSNKYYESIWKDDSGNPSLDEVLSFQDTEWYRVECPKCGREVVKAERFCPSCGIDLKKAKVTRKNDVYAYIDFMIPRLKEIHRVLKPTGSVYLHCDWHASHYLKIEMDRIFGYKNFINEIVWCYSGGNNATKYFPKKHDAIFWYSKGKTWTFNPDEVLIQSKSSASYYKDKEGREYTKKNGKIYYRRNQNGKIPEDYWTDINMLHHIAKERLGPPTQKPEALLSRIIKASSNKDDIVFDPFCGCGTATDVAQKLERKYIGIDMNPNACDMIARRLGTPPWKILGMPLTTAALSRLNPNDFQQWACTRMGAKNTSPNPTKNSGGDGGVDGVLPNNLRTKIFGGSLIQIKRSDRIGVNVVRNFASVLKEKDVKTGFIVALSFGKGAVDTVKEYKNKNIANIILIQAKDIAREGTFNKILLKLRRLE